MYDENRSSSLSAFIAGALIGAGLALLLAPRTGAELRALMGKYVPRTKEKLSDQGREAWDTAVERGKEYMERGTETLKEAGQKAHEALQTGKEAIEEAGKEIAKEAPKRT
jgi:gas vesicle protein